jgi:hypothetical protein
MEIRLHRLENLIATCWESAETATAKAIEDKYFDPPEECITFLFCCELRFAVDEASRGREFERAFVSDLHRQFRSLPANAFDSARGLIARVNLHSRRHEGLLSAADLGVIVTKPTVHGHPGSPQIRLLRDCSRGLIAQAKLNSRNGGGRLKWGPLTDNQEELLPAHLDYCALLLYRLEGQNRNKLAPFRWQSCRGFTVPEIKSWLRLGAVPKEVASGDIIRGLSGGKLGTNSSALIERFIDPSSSRPSAIEVRIFWPDGEGPPEHVTLARKVGQKTEQLVKVNL